MIPVSKRQRKGLHRFVWAWPVGALVLGCSLLPTPPSAFAQEKPPPKFNAHVELVSLDAEVLDRQGNPVTELVEKDFVVRENGKIVKLTHFARLTNRPVSLAIVLDNDLPREQLVIAREYVMRLMHVLAPGDEICLYTYGHKGTFLEQDFTTDRVPLLEVLRNIDRAPGAGGAKAVWDRLYGKSLASTAMGIDQALQNLHKAHKAKRAVLVISNRFQNLGPATVDHVQESGYTLLTLEFKSSTSHAPTLGGPQMDGRFWILSVDIEQILAKNGITKESGGRKFSADPEVITATSKSIVYALKNHYSLGYPTEVVGTGRQKPRKVEVLALDKQYSVYARRSYTPSP